MAEYIEREAALESVREKLLITDALPAGIPKDASTFTLASMQHSLEAIPAADVRPVVRGFNVGKDWPSLFECSVCGWSDGDTTTGDTRTYNYCPNCGATMEES